MTGYGRGDYQDDSFSFTFEIKTVNHRYAELSIRMPRFLAPLENRMRKVILDDVSRGHMDVFVNAAYTGTEGRQITIDKGLAKAYHDGLKELSALLGAHEGAVDEGREVLFVAKCPMWSSPERQRSILKRSGPICWVPSRRDCAIWTR